MSFKSRACVLGNLQTLEAINADLNTTLKQLRTIVPSLASITSPRSMAAFLMRLWGLFTRLQHCRKLVDRFQTAAQLLARDLSYDVSLDSIKLSRDSGYSPREYLPSHLALSLPQVEHLQAFNSQVEQYQSTMQVVEGIASEFVNLITDLRANHRGYIKAKSVCMGYTDVVSLMLRNINEKPTGREPHNNFILGMCINFDEAIPARRIRNILKPVYSLQKCPTLKRGQELHKQLNRTEYNPDRTLYSRFQAVRSILTRLYPAIGKGLACQGTRSYHDSAMQWLRFIPHYNKLNLVACRWSANKLDFSGVKTLLTGRPQVVAETERGEQIYSCSAIWIDRDQMVESEVYFYWSPNHGRDEKLQAYHASESQNVASILIQLDRKANAERERIERNRHLQLSQRQKFAELLRKCRSLESISVQDSYAVGNCVPGTAQFCASIGLTSDQTTIAGKLLAKIVRSKRSTVECQYNLFFNVVNALTIKQQATAKQVA